MACSVVHLALSPSRCSNHIILATSKANLYRVSVLFMATVALISVMILMPVHSAKGRQRSRR